MDAISRQMLFADKAGDVTIDEECSRIENSTRIHHG